MQKVKLPSNKKAQSKPKVTNKAPKKVNKTSNKKDLNDKQKLFALEFSKDINATRAYKAVYGGNDNVAGVGGLRLLRNDKIMNLVRETINNRFKELEVDGKRVLDRLVELVDRCMERKPVMERDGKERVQKTDIYEDPETGYNKVVGVRTFDSAGANSALDKLGKYFKLFVERVEHTGKDGEDIKIDASMGLGDLVRAFNQKIGKK